MKKLFVKKKKNVDDAVLNEEKIEIDFFFFFLFYFLFLIFYFFFSHGALSRELISNGDLLDFGQTIVKQEFHYIPIKLKIMKVLK